MGSFRCHHPFYLKKIYAIINVSSVISFRKKRDVFKLPFMQSSFPFDVHIFFFFFKEKNKKTCMSPIIIYINLIKT